MIQFSTVGTVGSKEQREGFWDGHPTFTCWHDPVVLLTLPSKNGHAAAETAKEK